MKKKINYKKEYKFYKEMYEFTTEQLGELYEHNKEKDSLLESSISELTLKNLRVDHLKNSLEEIKTILDKWVDNEIISKVISNEIERDNLDVIINNNLISKKI